MTLTEFKDALKKIFIGITILLYGFWIVDLIIGNYTQEEQLVEIFKFIFINIIVLWLFVSTIHKQVIERKYPDKYFALCLGFWGLLGYIIWMLIRPGHIKEVQTNIEVKQ